MTAKHALTAFAELLTGTNIGDVIPGTGCVVDASTVQTVHAIGRRLVSGMERAQEAAQRENGRPLDPAHCDAVRAQRGGEYGSFPSTLVELGITVGSLLRQAFPEFNGMDGAPRLPDLPPHVAGWIMVALKSHRAVHPARYDVDDYEDAFNYMRESSRTDPARLTMGARGEAGTETEEGDTE